MEAVSWDFSLTNEKEEPLRFRVKDGWDTAGEIGHYFGQVLIDQWWAIVLFDGEEDPETIKASALELLMPEWKDVPK